LACCRPRFVARRQLEFASDLVEVVRRECRPALHQRVVDRPEIAGRFGRVLRQFRGALCMAAVRVGAMPEDVPHLIPEPIPQIGDDFMHGVTGR
jgi:hypothetical protein